MQNALGRPPEPSLPAARIIGRWALVGLGAAQVSVLLLLTSYPGNEHGPRFPIWIVLPILLLVAGCGTVANNAGA